METFPVGRSQGSLFSSINNQYEESYDQSEPVVEPYAAARDAPMKGKFELSYVDGIKFNKNTVWRCKLDPGLKASSTTPVSNFDGSSDTQCFQLEPGF